MNEVHRIGHLIKRALRIFKDRFLNREVKPHTVEESRDRRAVYGLNGRGGVKKYGLQLFVLAKLPANLRIFVRFPKAGKLIVLRVQMSLNIDRRFTSCEIHLRSQQKFFEDANKSLKHILSEDQVHRSVSSGTLGVASYLVRRTPMNPAGFVARGIIKACRF